MIATSGFLTALNCTEFVFGRGSAPDPAGGGSLHRSPRLLSWLKGSILLRDKRRGRRGKGGRGKREGEKKGGKGRLCANEPSHFSEGSNASVELTYCRIS